MIIRTVEMSFGKTPLSSPFSVRRLGSVKRWQGGQVTVGSTIERIGLRRRRS